MAGEARSLPELILAQGGQHHAEIVLGFRSERARPLRYPVPGWPTAPVPGGVRRRPGGGMTAPSPVRRLLAALGLPPGTCTTPLTP